MSYYDRNPAASWPLDCWRRDDKTGISQYILAFRLRLLTHASEVHALERVKNSFTVKTRIKLNDLLLLSAASKVTEAELSNYTKDLLMYNPYYISIRSGSPSLYISRVKEIIHDTTLGGSCVLASKR